MEQRKDQSSSDPTESEPVAVPKCTASKEDPPRHPRQKASSNAKLKRYKSCEDLSDRHLKQAQQQCWRVFEEFVQVRKKSTHSHRRHRRSYSSTHSHASNCSAQSQGSSNSLADTPAQTPTVEEVPPVGRQKYRRLRSEPIDCAKTSPRETESFYHHKPCTVRKQRSKDADSIEEEEDERAPDCVVRSKPLNVVQVRPCSLGLEPQKTSPHSSKLSPFLCSGSRGTTHKRVPSNSSSENAVTPASDPLFSPIRSDLVETYPPARPPLFRTSDVDRSPLAPPPGICVTAGTPESQRHLCCGPSTSLPNEFPFQQFLPMESNGCPRNAHTIHRSRLIAEKLKILGDKLENEYLAGELESLISTAVLGNQVQTGLFPQYIEMLTNLFNQLSWQRVSEIFSVGYSLFEKMSTTLGDPTVDERWDLFQKLWETTVSVVAQWIRNNGGWGAFLRWTEGIARAGHSPKSDQDDAPGEPRPRLWSLSKAGSLVDEDGVTLLEASLEVDRDAGGDEKETEEGETSSDFEGSVGLDGIFPLDDDAFNTDSLSPSLFAEGGGVESHVGSLDTADGFCDSGITSSIEQLSLSPHESHHLLSASASSPNLPFCQRRRNHPTHNSPSGNDHSPHASAVARSLEDSPFDRNRSRSLPGHRRGQRPATLPRRPSERAIDSIFYTVNIGVPAAFFYAAVSHFLNK